MPETKAPLNGCARANWGASLVGSAPVEQAYVILEIPKPWPKKIKAEGPRADFKPLLKKGPEKLKLLATPRIDWLPADDGPWALLVRWHQGRASLTEVPARPEAIQAALREPAPPTDLRLYLVCTHGTRDRCCGTLGVPVYQALKSCSRRHVLQVSHLGGHRYAPVVLALPEWRFFGHLDSLTCRTLDAALERNEPYLPGYRGHGRLEESLQPIEAELWSRWGGQLTEIRPLRRLSRELIEVEAQLADHQVRLYRARLGSQTLEGFKSCEDMGPEARVKSFELPTLEDLEEISRA